MRRGPGPGHPPGGGAPDNAGAVAISDTFHQVICPVVEAWVLRATLRATRIEPERSAANHDGQKPLQRNGFWSLTNPQKLTNWAYGSEGWGFESLRARREQAGHCGCWSSDGAFKGGRRRLCSESHRWRTAAGRRRSPGPTMPPFAAGRCRDRKVTRSRIHVV